MSVELGALSLLITAPGGKETLDTLGRVDRTAKHTASAWGEAWRGVGKETGRLKQNLAELVNPLTAVKTAVGALAAAFAVEKVAEFFGETVREANAGARALAQLSLAVRNAGGDVASWRGALDEAAEGVSRLAGVSVPDARKALAALVTTTHDVAASTKALGVVADFAAARQLPLAEAAEIVGRAMAGNTQILQHLGVRVHDVTTVVEDVGRTFRGAATEGLSPFERAQRAAAVEMGNLKEAIGEALLATGDARRGVDAWSGALRAATGWVQQHHHEIGALVAGLSALAGATLRVVGETAAWIAKHRDLLASLAAGTAAVWAAQRAVVAYQAAVLALNGAQGLSLLVAGLARLRVALAGLSLASLNPTVLALAAIGAAVAGVTYVLQGSRRETQRLAEAVGTMTDQELFARKLAYEALVKDAAARGRESAALRARLKLLDEEIARRKELAAVGGEGAGPGTGGVPTPTGTRSQAQVDALRAQIQAELALATERNAAAAALNEQQYAQGLEGLEAYGEKRLALVREQSAATLGALARERAAVQSLRTLDGNDEEQKKKALAELNGRIAVQRVKGLGDERAALEAVRVARKALTEATAADLGHDLELQGQRRAAAQAATEAEVRSYRELLDQLHVVGAAQEALVARRRALLTDRADFDDAQRQAAQTLGEVAALRTSLDAEVRAGTLSQLDADRQVAEAERDRLPALQLLADRMAAFAATLKDPALIQAARDLAAQLTGMAVVITPEVRLKQATQQMKDDLESDFALVGPRVAGVLGDSLGAAFAGGMKHAGKALLKGLGEIFSQMGQKLVVFGLTMLKLLPALSNPFTAGPAAIIAGAALLALGATLGAIATGKSGGGGGAGAAPASDPSVARVTLGSAYAPNVRQVSGPPIAGLHYGAAGAGAGALPPGADLVGRVAVAPPPAYAPAAPPRPQVFNVFGNTPEVQRFISEVSVSGASRNLPFGVRRGGAG